MSEPVKPFSGTAADTAGTLADTAFEALRRDIIHGVRRPMERLRIDRLKRLYGVGPTPLREALQRLHAEGLVAQQGNRGFTVAGLDLADFADLNLARTVLEKEALRLSIERGDDAWEAAVVSAAYRLEKADAQLAADMPESLDRWEEANAAFHHALVAACGSRWLLRVRAGLQDHSERYRRASVYLRRGVRNLRAEHRAIAEAVLARDAAAACQLIEAHYTATARHLADDFAQAAAGADAFTDDVEDDAATPGMGD